MCEEGDCFQFVSSIGARGSEDTLGERGEWRDGIKKTEERELERKDLALLPPSRQNQETSYTPLPAHTHTIPAHYLP